MRSVHAALVVGCAAWVCPAAARAEPISTVFSTSAGASVELPDVAAGGSALDLGRITLGGGSSAIVFIDDLPGRANVPVTFTLVDPASHPFTDFTVELLDPLSDGFDAMDPKPQPGYVPAGYSTSNNTDGLSFAWNSGLARSAVFADGGGATLQVDEDTNARDLLSFHGFSGGTQAKVSFGVRDNLGNRGFLVRFKVNGDPGGASTPEPGSLLLLGTGIAGLLRFGRRLV
jgi:PEP-CTERM motif